jgi:superfamily II DNA or RNA helicase
MASLDTLFAAIRSACTPGAWSSGVELARGDAVHGERDEGDEVVLRVSTRGGLLSPAVRISLDDEDWDCDCASRDDACEHVAAAMIALRRARRAGEALPTAAEEVGRVGVRLTRRGHGLDFERVIVIGEKEEPLRSTLAAVSSGRVDGPRFLATAADVAVERALGSHLRGALPRGVWSSLLRALIGCDDVRFDGEPVRASLEPVGFIGQLEDAPQGFRLRARRDPRVVETFSCDLALLNDGTLCPMGGSNLSGRELEDLQRGRVYRADEAAELVTEVLPSLRERIRVEIKTDRLPQTSSDPPRITLEIERKGEALCVLPLLVYGDPPTARVDAGRLVPLGGPVPLRDEPAERELLRRLQSDLELAPGRKLVATGEDALALAERLQRWPGAVGAEALAAFTRESTLAPRFSAGERHFDLVFESFGDDAMTRTAPAGRVLTAWREGESWVPLSGGGFAELPRDWLARHGDRVADLLAARGEGGELPTAALPELATLAEELDAPVPEAASALRDALAALADDDAAGTPLPADLTASLRGYQREGVRWLDRQRELGLPALLADDMGLGKTVQALCSVRGRTLVVAPTSVVPNWAAEAARFRPALRVCVYHGPGRALDPEADLTLTSYALLRLDAEALTGIEWDTVLLDESQAIKNPDSQVARTAHRLPGRFRLALTGTPVENRLTELWSQFQFLSRGWLGARRDSESEREIYDAIRAATHDEVAARFGSGGNAFQILEALLRLRQAACDANLVPGAHVERSSKLEVLRENLDESVAEGHKSLVFSQWTSLLDRIEPELRDAEIPFTRLDGSTRDRAGVVADFQREDGPPVLLVSLRAGGSGLNLTAADTVYILDPWWNPAVEQQAADRTHRIGQTRPVNIYRLVASDTVEERVLALQEHKRGLAEAALGAEGGTGITREELLELLR